jgi:hypothetical protein
MLLIGNNKLFSILFQSIFSNIKERLQNSAMKLVHNERNGEAFDSQLVIGVRESYVNLCSNPQGKCLVNNVMHFHLS